MAAPAIPIVIRMNLKSPKSSYAANSFRAASGVRSC
jgi:hypothetical protein